MIVSLERKLVARLTLSLVDLGEGARKSSAISLPRDEPSLS
jgi:hypothetical protein